MKGKIKAQERRKADRGDGNVPKLRLGAASHDHGPHHIELLLNGDGPGNAEWPCCTGRVVNQEVLKKKWVGPPGRRARDNNGTYRGTQKRDNHKHEEEDGVI